MLFYFSSIKNLLKLLMLLCGESQASSTLVDSASGHQETPKPPSGGFLVSFWYKLINYQWS
jgi:hypothetical protein